MDEKECIKWIIGGVLSFVAVFGTLVIIGSTIKANAQVAAAKEVGAAIIVAAEAWN